MDYLVLFQQVIMFYYLVLNTLLQVNQSNELFHFIRILILAGAAQWLVVMAVLYITGALLYAGKFEQEIIFVF